MSESEWRIYSAKTPKMGMSVDGKSVDTYKALSFELNKIAEGKSLELLRYCLSDARTVVKDQLATKGVSATFDKEAESTLTVTKSEDGVVTIQLSVPLLVAKAVGAYSFAAVDGTLITTIKGDAVSAKCSYGNIELLAAKATLEDLKLAEKVFSKVAPVVVQPKGETLVEKKEEEVKAPSEV